MKHFADRLTESILRRKTPVLVGLDPRADQLPAGLLSAGATGDLKLVAEVNTTFCRCVIYVVVPLGAAVNPQAAFFEQLGPPGMTALADVIDYARQHELIVILDGKRNDIGSTAAAYAQAYLGAKPASAWGADALTVSPYLGDDSLTPFVEAAQATGSGVFVLVKTSNPGGKLFQDARADGRPLSEHVALHVEKLAEQTLGDGEYGAVGAVVGATYPEQLAELRELMPHAWFLVPGYGAQGAGAKDVAAAFDNRGLGAIVNSSRGIIFAHARPEYKKQFGDARWQDAVEAATRDMIAQLRAETPAGNL